MEIDLESLARDLRELGCDIDRDRTGDPLKTIWVNTAADRLIAVVRRDGTAHLFLSVDDMPVFDVIHKYIKGATS